MKAKVFARHDAFARLRIKHGLTQRELARRTGLSNSYISLLERTVKPVGPAAAKRLTDALGVPFDDLFRIE